MDDRGLLTLYTIGFVAATLYYHPMFIIGQVVYILIKMIFGKTLMLLRIYSLRRLFGCHIFRVG